MTQNPQLYFYSRKGAFRLTKPDLWQRLFATLIKAGWRPPSETETNWLESPLNQYRPGSFFSEGDAASCAQRLEHLDLPEADLVTLARAVAALLRAGPLFIWHDPPRDTEGSSSVEVVYVYFCPECGFMHHGSWLFDEREAGRDEIVSTARAMLEYKYCPLCSSTEILSEAFLQLQVTVSALPDVMREHERFVSPAP